MAKHNNPFYFALPTGATPESRARAPRHIAETYGIEGMIEFVRAEPAFRLYRITAG